MIDIFKQTIFNFKLLLGRHQSFSAYNRILLNECKPISEIKAYQEALLQNIVAHAFTKVPFYRNLYANAGFSLDSMNQPKWFEKLPIVTKADLREHFKEFIDPAQEKFLKVSTTGGSTGIPTKTGYDGRIPEEIYSWRLQNRFGVHPWDNHAYIWRDTRKSKSAKFKNAVLWWPTRHIKLDASCMTNGSISDFLREFNEIRPSLLQGYVGAVSHVAKYIVDNRLKVWTPKVVWTTSSPLPVIQRSLIQKAFGAPVCDEYGCCELRWMASQCSVCKGLHVNIEHVYIEFVDDVNIPVSRGEYGRTLITNMEDTVFPLIRYENQDRGRWLSEPCECGSSLPCIDSIKGREVESFTLPSGKIVNGEYLTTIFDTSPDVILGFRVVQHKDMSITVECIPRSVDDRSNIEAIVHDFSLKLGGEVPVTCKFVSTIAHDRGKQRFVVKEE